MADEGFAAVERRIRACQGEQFFTRSGLPMIYAVEGERIKGEGQLHHLTAACPSGLARGDPVDQHLQCVIGRGAAGFGQAPDIEREHGRTGNGAGSVEREILR